MSLPHWNLESDISDGPRPVWCLESLFLIVLTLMLSYFIHSLLGSWRSSLPHSFMLPVNIFAWLWHCFYWHIFSFIEEDSMQKQMGNVSREETVRCKRKFQEWKALWQKWEVPLMASSTAWTCVRKEFQWNWKYVNRIFPNYWESESVKVTQFCPTLCSPMDYTVHGIL